MKSRTTSVDVEQDSEPPSALPTPTPPPVERGKVQRGKVQRGKVQRGKVQRGKVQSQLPLAPPRPDEQRRPASAIEQSPGWLASILLHLLLLLILTLVVPAASVGDRMILLVPRAEQESQAEVELAELAFVEPPEFEVDSIEDTVDIDKLFQDTEVRQSDILDQATAIPNLVDPMSALAFSSDPKALIRLPPSMDRSGLEAGHNSSLAMIGVSGDAGADNGAHGELGGRASRRIRLATPEMNYAINNGLNWLARHQLADGGWSFNHQIGECRGRCPDRGTKHDARIAGTGLALLPFLGAGHSPLHGEYRQTVSAGINFLIANTSRNGSLWFRQGRMYGHGIATLALCECYGIMKQTKRHDLEDAGPMASEAAYPQRPNANLQPLKPGAAVDVERLGQTAAAAIGFIVRAQAKDGGWRYHPGELGDTSVVGWQVMALKSAKEAGFEVSEKTVAAAGRFLDSVQLDPVGDSSGFLGTRYAYKPDKHTVTHATTAIGLACRICMGASPFHPAIETAVTQMVTNGHRGGDLYYNFYANQVVFQHGGTS